MRLRTVLVGLILLRVATNAGAAHAQECPRLDCDQTRISATASIQVVDNSIYGTISCEGDFWRNIYDNSLFACGFYPGNWGLSAVYRSYPPTGTFGGISAALRTCERQQACQWRSTVTNGFHLDVLPGSYEVRWQVGACVLYSRIISLPAQSWDTPTCSTCIGDSATVCVHPTPRSLVVSSKPDVTLLSPLGNRTIERTYRTSLIGDPTAGNGMFGKGWQANFEYRVGAIGGNTTSGVMLFDAAGRKVFYHRDYSRSPESYESPDGKGGRITRNPDGSYLWQDAHGSSYQFDTAGRILTITDMHGNQESFGYAGDRITSLTDRHGRIISFDYQGTNFVRQLLGPPVAANPNGVYATYAYDASGNLTDVTYPDGSSLVYGYGNTSWPNSMTRYSARGPRGPNLQQLFQYDDRGRVQAVSEGPEGRSYQLAYAYEYVDIDPSHPQLGQKTLSHTTVTEWTDANWDFQIDNGEVQTAQRTYWFENHGGADVITRIEDGACSCAAEKVYDSAFHVVRSKDDRGVTTLMNYDGHGELISLTGAAGTADERSTAYEYVYAPVPVFPGQILQKTIRQQSVSSVNDDTLTTEINDPATGALLARREQGYRVDGSPLTAETVYTHTASGALQAIDGPRQGTLDQISYDYYPAGAPAAGMLWKITEPNGAVTMFQQYDGLGNVLRKTDANNRDTTFD